MAFAPAAPVTGFFGPATAVDRTVCVTAVPEAAPAAPAPTGTAGLDMRCRRDLKHEKRCRNAVFARAHRVKPIRTNRRAAANAKDNDDTVYLSNIYATLPFGTKDGEPSSRDNDRNQGGRGGSRK